MPDAATSETPTEKARALFAGEELPFPPLSSDLAAALREVAPGVFSTRPEENSPYNLEIFSLEAQSAPAVSNYALVGFDGHGINSWAMHYYLVDDALALFLQLPWGGAYEDPAEARRAIGEAFRWAEKLQDDTKRAHAQGLIPAGWRLLAVTSGFAETGWAFIPSPPPGPEAVEWHAVRNVRTEVDDALAELFAGRIKLG